ncbi:heme ABC transporter ATP-binding protein [Sphingobacterium corticis]|uniref:Heme ABC transporter ATP-binding protein n=1 Tax=Sphingobacterium corticis TaxID=1812823 RepID=A0ABW5NKW0_9SPHI
MLFAENLSYSIKKNTLLRNFNLSIRPGEFLAVLGANGAGKSTLIKLLSGEHTPSEGSIQLHGKPLTAYSDLQLAGFRATMMQQQHISADFTVEEIVLMGRYPHYQNRPSEQDLAIVQQTMQITGIELLAERSVLSLSGGERQRVQLARILAQIWHQPNALLLLDEPVSAMDIRFQHQTLSIARALADKGWMVMSILHDINLASQYADRLLMMKNGRKLMDGTSSEVLTSRNIYTVFGIDAEVAVNPKTLHTYIVPKAIKVEIENVATLGSAVNKANEQSSDQQNTLISTSW